MSDARAIRTNGIGNVSTYHLNFDRIISLDEKRDNGERHNAVDLTGQMLSDYQTAIRKGFSSAEAVEIALASQPHSPALHTLSR